MAVAVTQFEAMWFSFKLSIMSFFRKYYRIFNIVDDKILNDFISTVKKGNDKNTNANENKCTKLKNYSRKDKHNVKKAVESLIDRMRDKDNPFKIPNINDQS